MNISKPKAKYRPVKERGPLQAALHTWRSHAHQADPLRAVRQIFWILSDAAIELIAKTLPTKVSTVDQLADLLDVDKDWASEWGSQVLQQINVFDSKK